MAEPISETPIGEPSPAAEKRPHVHRDRSMQDFLDALGRAVTAGDGAAAAALWDVPALVVSDADVMAIESRDQIAQFFGGAKAQYNAKGIVDTRAEIVRQWWPTDRIAIVEVRWPYLDADGDERGDETSTYTIRRDDSGDLHLRVAVMHGANERTS